MSKEIRKVVGDHLSPFARIKRTNDANNEYWDSRELAEVLEYTQYRNFEAVVEKAKLACFNSGHRIEDHFADVSKMVGIGSGTNREIKVTLLSRYACYLVIQNADPKKAIVAHGQTYFASQTRRQELADEHVEEKRRLILRDEMRQHNAQLADAAQKAGVIEPIDYAIFQNHGYMGLYNGLKQEDIHRRKGLKKSQKILDHMGSTELAANLFRATQAEEKLRRDEVKGKDAANRTHREVGAKVRQTIRELAYWLIGREIVQEIQGGDERAEYGKRVIEQLSAKLALKYGRGFSTTNLRYFRTFYTVYSNRIAEIRHIAYGESEGAATLATIF